jgi:uncharacterized protein with HEPN domain
VNERDPVYLRHILEAISQIKTFSKDISSATELRDNALPRAGIERMLTVIGEAAKQVSSELKEKHPEIPWKEISGMRDKIIHHYFGVDFEAIWLTITNDLGRSQRKNYQNPRAAKRIILPGIHHSYPPPNLLPVSWPS